MLDTDVDCFAILNSLGEGVTLANADGRVFFSNAEADRILGATVDAAPVDVAGYYGVFLPDGESPFPTNQHPVVRALQGDISTDVEILVRNPHAPHGRLVIVNGRPFKNSQGAIVGALVTYRDITTIRAVERKRDELSALMVHDLKSPLTTIMGEADLLALSDKLQGEERDSVVGIRNASRRLHRLVLDLLDIHLAEDGALRVDESDVSVATLLNETHECVKPRLAHIGQQIQKPDAPLEMYCTVDRGLMNRVIQNLIDNCVKYGRKGGRIWLDAAASAPDSVVIRVRDDGPGVPPEIRTEIFEKYSTAERDEKSRRLDSRGLGLHFCKVAVEAHRGRIWVEDNEPQGACFCIRLPAATQAQVAGDDSVASEGPSSEPKKPLPSLPTYVRHGARKELE